MTIAGLVGMEAAGIEPAPVGAKTSAESRPYLTTARNDSESYPAASRVIPSCPTPFRRLLRHTCNMAEPEAV